MMRFTSAYIWKSYIDFWNQVISQKTDKNYKIIHNYHDFKLNTDLIIPLPSFDYSQYKYDNFNDLNQWLKIIDLDIQVILWSRYGWRQSNLPFNQFVDELDLQKLSHKHKNCQKIIFDWNFLNQVKSKYSS